ncbi:hypothetical protein GS942_23360 [Rhodococcus hoagii]|nr:hypothetical protein [Prescottella equi]NKZ71147.1 hypothetical protein [Prescottella equi]
MTDTINTLADPGSDPAHEWQQPENAETILHAITPASLRAHADWIDGCESTLASGVTAERLRVLAEHLEAESAREDRLLELAKEFWCGMGGEYDDPDPEDVAQAWEDMTPEWKRRYANGVRAVLAADGRLLPEGGIALTRREAEGFVTVLQRHYPEGEAALLASLRERLDAPPAASVPDGGPDGTPEKPWPTWQEVPEGVKYRSADGCYCFVNRNGSRFPAGSAGESKFRSSFSDVVMGTLAPFVRVDGDQA